MLPVKIYLNNLKNEISEENIMSISLSTDIKSPYVAASLSLQSYTSDIFNMIMTGVLIYIKILYNEEEYLIPFRVSSFTKKPKNDISTANEISMVLLHDWFFTDDVRSSAYKGTVSEITENLLKSEGKNIFKYNITPTADRFSTRYRIKETSLHFLSRISKYGILRNYPVYLFMDLKNTVHLQGIADIQDQSCAKCILPIEAAITPTILPDLSNYQVLYANSHQLSSNIFNSNSRINMKFSFLNFYTQSAELKDNKVISYERLSEQSSKPSTSKTVYSSWNKTPMDSAACLVRNAFEQNLDSLSAVVTLKGVCLEETTPGTLVRLILPGLPQTGRKSGQEINIGEEIYMVRKAMVVLAKGISSTKLHLIPISPIE